jgi:hypothetical protein
VALDFPDLARQLVEATPANSAGAWHGAVLAQLRRNQQVLRGYRMTESVEPATVFRP